MTESNEESNPQEEFDAAVTRLRSEWEKYKHQVAVNQMSSQREEISGSALAGALDWFEACAADLVAYIEAYEDEDEDEDGETAGGQEEDC